MRRLVFVLTMVAMLVVAGPVAASHSGPEELARGRGAVQSTSDVTTGFFAEVCQFGFCFGVFQLATIRTVTETNQTFDFDARLATQTSAHLTTDAHGHMKLNHTSTRTVTVTLDPTIGFVCTDPTFQTIPACPTPGTTTTSEAATVSADVTCLRVVQNRAAIGGHVTKWSGSLPPTRGLLFNATDNTIAGQQLTPDRFLGAFSATVPDICPTPAADQPITKGDIYVQQS